MNKEFRRGLWIYVILILVGFGIYAYFTRVNGQVDANYTNASLKKALADKDIEEVIILPNEEVPTGVVTIKKRMKSCVSIPRT